VKIKILLICLGAAAGGLLLGISYSSKIGPEPVSIRELVPPEMRDIVQDTNTVAISKRVNIVVSPFRAVIGGTFGGLIGFVLSFVVRKWKPPKHRVEMKAPEKRRSLVIYNLKVLFILICLVIALWLVFFILLS